MAKVELSGGDFIFQNDFETIIFRARMAVSIFALMVALLAFLSAREMFGTGAGFITLLLLRTEFPCSRCPGNH